MKKRVLAGVLWFYVTWYAWSLVAWFTGMPDALGPILGLVAAALIAGDPMHRIWAPRPKPEAAVPIPTPSAEPA